MPNRTKILIADDEANILNLAGETLRQFGYEVITAGDGKSAIEKAISERPDLIVLDRNMPGMDGTEVCRKIRDNKFIGTTPIIFLTAQDSNKQILEGLAQGANDYITKPFNMSELTERVKSLLEKQKGRSS